MTVALEDLEFAGIDPANAADAPLLNGLQGNVLKSHGRNNAFLLLLKLSHQPEHVAALKLWVRCLPVTSAVQQLADSAAFRASGRSDRLFVGFYLSANGYKVLGIPVGQWPRDVAFRQGMKRASVAKLSDPPIAQWDPPYRGDVDAMLLLAHDDQAQLTQHLSLIRDELGAIDPSVIIAVETGITLRNNQHETIEHFGAIDGISQPLFLKSDIDKFRAAAPSGAWDPTADPFRLVLAEDPMAPRLYGSYLVLRKLEQDIVGFNRDLLRLASRLDGDTPNTDLTSALAVGRFKNGTPVVLHSTPMADADRNSFTYLGDHGGLQCPLQAHTRTMNPRGHESLERSRRIVRRGIPYGDPNGSDAKGLLFLCFQQDISRQFEHLQGIWANLDVDALIGQPPRGQPIIPRFWPRRWGDSSAGVSRMAFGGHVTMRGGEYFFAPSIAALRSL